MNIEQTTFINLCHPRHTFSCDVRNSTQYLFTGFIYKLLTSTVYRFMPVHDSLILLRIKRTGAECWSVSALLLLCLWTYCTGSCWLCPFCLITFCSMLHSSPLLTSSPFFSCFHNFSPCSRFPFSSRSSCFIPSFPCIGCFYYCNPNCPLMQFDTD